jgi:hypothetical protein
MRKLNKRNHEGEKLGWNIMRKSSQATFILPTERKE